MDNTASPSPTTPPFQFTLRQLMLAMGFACVIAASIYWLGPFLSTIAIVPISAITLAIYFYRKDQIERSNIALVFGGLLTVLLLPLSNRPEVPNGGCRNNLHNLALALQMYESTYGSLPPACVADASGRPMHSWRVLLLPYLEQKRIYDRYDFNEPWDGPNNSALAVELNRIWVYQCPTRKILGETSYVAVTGPQTMWPNDKSTKLSDVKDGTNKTIMLVEVHNSGIHWMEPRDLDFSQMPMAVNPPRGVGISSGHSVAGTDVVLANGVVKHLRNDTPSQSLRAWLTINGGEKVKEP